MYTLHFIYPSIHCGTLGCFHLLAIINMVLGALLCKYMLESLRSLLLGINPGVELLDHVGILRLTFRGAAILFSTTVHHFAVPPFFLFFSQNSSSATALQHLPFISTPQTATLYTKWLCLSHLLEGKKKVALIVKSVVLQRGLAAGDWWSPLHPIRYFILVKWRAANFVKYF